MIVSNYKSKYNNFRGTVGRSRLRVDSDKYKGVADKTGVGVVLSGSNCSDLCRMGAELCTFYGEVMLRVGSELVDSNEVDEDDGA